MLDSTFREVLDRAAEGDPVAQRRLDELAREGVLDAHVARLRAAEDADWEALVSLAVEQSGGPLTAGSLVDGMLDMAGLPAVSLAGGAGRTVDTGTFTAPSAAAPPQLSWGARLRLQERIENRDRIEDPGWAERSADQIRAVLDVHAYRTAAPAAERVVDPDAELSMGEFAAKYGIGG